MLIAEHGLRFEKIPVAIERDGTKLSRATMEDIRTRAVQQVESGESPKLVIAFLGFSRPGICEWLALDREGGIDAMRSRKAP